MSKRKQDDSGEPFPDKRAKGNAGDENGKGSTFVVTVVNDSIQGMQEWTEEETAQLKQAVDADGGQLNWDAIASSVPSKDINQVKTYVLSMLPSAESQNNQSANVIKAPIEIWTDLAQKLTSEEDKAAAVCVPQLMVAAAAEPTNAHGHEAAGPNYSQIYLYLSSLLRGETPQVLRPLESSVVLSLIQEIVNKIRSSDLSGQMHFLASSYKTFQSYDAKADKSVDSRQSESPKSSAGANASSAVSPGINKQPSERRTSSGRIVRQRVQLIVDSEEEDEEVTEEKEDGTPALKPRPTSLNPFRIPVNLLNFKSRRQLPKQV